ncbi:MAG: hypothetical protein E6R03_17075 [Hyphomicrobiaceae bacterium]|nr:MAG: hypothetical protein E6R03_17075 [Hyphomicrobiaceae bacterium]
MIEYRRVFGPREDVERIQAVLREAGLDFSYSDCDALWRHHSDQFAASWMSLPTTNDALLECLCEQIKSYAEEV